MHCHFFFPSQTLSSHSEHLNILPLVSNRLLLLSLSPLLDFLFGLFLALTCRSLLIWSYFLYQESSRTLKEPVGTVYSNNTAHPEPDASAIEQNSSDGQGSAQGIYLFIFFELNIFLFCLLRL